MYDAETRLNQTIETCKSIRAKCDADIIVLDGGQRRITQEERDILSPYIDRFYDFADEPTVQTIQKAGGTNWDIVKNMIEIVMFGSFFELLSKGEVDVGPYDRIFKMSGRYTLNDSFDYQSHLDAKDKVVIRGPYTSQFTSEITGGVSLQYMSRLWSFDYSLLSYVADMYADMFTHMNDRLNNKGYIDIEHLLYSHLKQDIVITPERIGIEGNIAPNGAAISD